MDAKKGGRFGGLGIEKINVQKIAVGRIPPLAPPGDGEAIAGKISPETLQVSARAKPGGPKRGKTPIGGLRRIGLPAALLIRFQERRF
jgi:hypothetical protein